jgi:alginate O-acetyltransferase complex protein AlgJ
MFPVMSSASKINGILFCVLLCGMFLYSLPAVIAFSGTQTQALFREGASGVVLGRDGWLFTNQEYLVPNDMEQNLDKQLALIDKIHQQLEQKGKRLIMLPVPMKLDTYAEHSTYVPSEPISDLYQHFRQRLAERGIDTVDLRSTYQSVAASEPLFLRNDTHWSPKGAELAAQTLAQQFPELLGDTPYITQAAGEKQISGDLLNYLKFDPRLAPSYFEPVYIELHETLKQEKGGLDDSLFGEEAISLALVGTSYTRIDDWNFAGFLKQALQRDLVTVALEARGPFESMNEFLAGPAAAGDEVQTVIWEFPLRTLLAQRQIPSP